MPEEIVNKIAESGLITLDLEQYMPADNTIVSFDLKDYLFMELILKEKDFRAALLQHNWNQYQNKNIAVHCTADAVVPMWAYMLIASYMQPFAKEIVFGTAEELRKQLMLKNILAINTSEFQDKRVVIKGCGDIPI